jgi:exodeoxyribonuclease V alpha subunit
MDRFAAMIRRNVPRFALDAHAVECCLVLAEVEDGLSAREREALLVLLAASLVTLRQGSSRLTLDGDGSAWLEEVAAGLLAVAEPEESPEPAEPAAEVLSRIRGLLESGRLPQLVGGPGDRRPFVLVPPHLYPQRMHALEDRLATALHRMAERRAGGERPALPGPLDAMLVAAASALAPEQVEAVRRAVASPLTFIAGGPGTGKTTVVATLVRVLLLFGIRPAEIALAAPTGKAARRLDAVVRRHAPAGRAVSGPPDLDSLVAELGEAATLHRLLGYSPSSESFRHHRGNPLDARFVIVDEASMIDLALMERLVAGLRSDAQLVLIGDADQLPSVEAGAVFRELAGSSAVDAAVAAAAADPLAAFRVRLALPHRTLASGQVGASLSRASRSIRAGDARGLLAEAPPPVASARDLRFEGLELLSAPGALSDLVETWHVRFSLASPEAAPLVRREYAFPGPLFADADEEDLARLFAHVDRARILCLTHAGPAGTDRINETLRVRQQEALSSGGDRTFDLYPGDPVIMLHNDYARGLFNGDTGVVLRVREPGGEQHFRAVFPRGAAGHAAFALGPLRPHLALAHALTVHKSQGSEHDHVALVLPAEDIPLNTRELVYTAVTRARRSTTIVGNPEVLAAGVTRRLPRASGLAERLASLALVTAAGRSAAPQGRARRA